MIVKFLITTSCKKYNITHEICGGRETPVLIKWNVFYSNSELWSAILLVECNLDGICSHYYTVISRRPEIEGGW